MNAWFSWIPHGIDLVGYAAAGLVLMAFSLHSLVALRSVAIASNVTFIAYASVAHLHPVLVLHAALLPINVWRLWQSTRAAPADKQSAGRGAAVREGAGRTGPSRACRLRADIS
jgi:hypothetical protein